MHQVVAIPAKHDLGPLVAHAKINGIVAAQIGVVHAGHLPEDKAEILHQIGIGQGHAVDAEVRRPFKGNIAVHLPGREDVCEGGIGINGIVQIIHHVLDDGIAFRIRCIQGDIVRHTVQGHREGSGGLNVRYSVSPEGDQTVKGKGPGACFRFQHHPEQIPLEVAAIAEQELIVAVDRRIGNIAVDDVSAHGQAAVTGQVAVLVHGDGTGRHALRGLVQTARPAHDDVVAQTAEQGVGPAKGRRGGIEVIVPGRLSESDDHAVITKEDVVPLMTLNVVAAAAAEEDVMTHIPRQSVVSLSPGHGGPDPGELIQGIVLCGPVVAKENVQTEIAGDLVIFGPAENDVVAVPAVDDIAAALEGDIRTIMIQLNGFQVGRKAQRIGQVLHHGHGPDLGVIHPAVVAEDDLGPVVCPAAVDPVVARAAQNDVGVLGVYVTSLDFPVDLVVSAIDGVAALKDLDGVFRISLDPSPVAAYVVLTRPAIKDIAAHPVRIRIARAADDNVVTRAAPERVLAAEGRILGPDIIGDTGAIGVEGGIRIDSHHHTVVTQDGVPGGIPSALDRIVTRPADEDIRTPILCGRRPRLRFRIHVNPVIAAKARVVHIRSRGDVRMQGSGLDALHHILCAALHITVITQDHVRALVTGERVSPVAGSLYGIVIL